MNRYDEEKRARAARDKERTRTAEASFSRAARDKERTRTAEASFSRTAREMQTGILNEMILGSGDQDDFREQILHIVDEQKTDFQRRIRRIMEEQGYSKETLARACGVSRQSVIKWCSGSVPQSREMFIRIGFAAHYSLEEMDHFLQRYGRYPKLYVKSPEDCVYRFVLLSKELPHTFETCLKLMKTVEQYIDSERTPMQLQETGVLEEQFLKLKKEDEFLRFIRENMIGSEMPFADFYAYIKIYLLANTSMEEEIAGDGRISVNELAQEQGWTAQMRKSVSAIRRGKWFPVRRQVIELGLYLNMNYAQINKALSLAKMEPLCSKNPQEAAIIFALKEAELEEMIFTDGSSQLHDYVRKVQDEFGV